MQSSADNSAEVFTPSIIVIFGITGDLAQRKLLPALYRLFKDDLLDPQTVILGITRRDVSATQLLEQVELCVNEIDQVCDPIVLQKVHGALRMHQMSQTDPAEYRELYELLNSIEAEQGVCMNRLYYLSIPPQMFGPIVRNLGEQGLNESCQHGVAATRLLVEKPFGYDLGSARELIAETAEWFSEEQVFRIDHYLAKDAVQDILAFRASDPAVEQLWNSDHIEHITITAYEKIDIEGRTTFYEAVGALRDFIQSHLLQVAAVATMDLPASSESSAVHAARLALLTGIQPVSAEQIAGTAVRGQYQGYREAVGVPDSITETFARITIAIDHPRWQDTKLTLQTGKAMAEKRTDVRVKFRGSTSELVFDIQNDSGVSLIDPHQAPEAIAALQPLIEGFNKQHSNTSSTHPDAYERVLLDAICGDHNLFTTGDEVIAAWQVVEGIVKAWGNSGEGLVRYPKGSRDVA
ncbi:MAG TPA: glucose-6-phosphate dehydrogenase [Candidatus Saccharimonadales bacterium]|nr:glucose-6-phosphate dehydrogenase [Candidatus Saccharimonadales bacterium]